MLTDTDARDFVEWFASGWALPKPEPFLDHFLPAVAPDAIFTQPLFPRALGTAGFEDLFRRLFGLLPDLVATVHTWGRTEDTIFIASTCSGTLGSKAVTFEVCDRVTVAAGLIRSRHSYSDPLPLLLLTMRQPRIWWRTLAVLQLSPQRREPRP